MAQSETAAPDGSDPGCRPELEAGTQNADGVHEDERSSDDHPTVARPAEGVPLPVPLFTDTVHQPRKTDVHNMQPLRRSERTRKRKVMFDV